MNYASALAEALAIRLELAPVGPDEWCGHAPLCDVEAVVTDAHLHRILPRSAGSYFSAGADDRVVSLRRMPSGSVSLYLHVIPERTHHGQPVNA